MHIVHVTHDLLTKNKAKRRKQRVCVRVRVFTERAGLFVTGFVVASVSSTGLPAVLRLRVGTRPLTAR